MLQVTMSREEARRAVTDRVPEATRRIFKKQVPGRSFADLGCMWNCHGAYAYCAELMGAKGPILAFDGLDPTDQFHAYHDALDSMVEYRQGDILKLDPEEHGRYDVVFCSGVLYHMPDPMRMLDRVTSLAKQTLILCTHTIEGDEPIIRFYPHSKQREPYPWEVVAGAAPEWRRPKGYEDYAPWWCGPTERAVDQMLRCFQFVVHDTHRYTLNMVPGHKQNPQISTFVAHRVS